MTLPKVSIVTPSYNHARFLPETLRAVRGQDYPNTEHLIMDGGSTDGTLELLRAAPGIRWWSAADRGQVHALNQGFHHATGQILAWLNSDDTMPRDTVRLAVTALEKTGADLVYGDVEVVDEQGAVLKHSAGIPFDLRILLYGINYIGQQTVFFRRTLLERAGPLREEFNLAFDYELWLRLSLAGKFAYVPELRAQIRVHPTAKSITQPRAAQAETDRIRREYWERGGLPAFCQHPWLFSAVNYYYRLKRWRRVRRS